MTSIPLRSYRGHDLPAHLALSGLAVVFDRVGCPARVGWTRTPNGWHGRLDLPDGWDEARALTTLTTAATVRADSPDWALLDLCDDSAGWEEAARRVLPAIDPHDRSAADLLTGAAYYRGGEGGRSPLILTARNATPGRWGRKAAAAAVKTDWRTHFAAWDEGGGSWQGWRPATEKTADLAAVWLALEGLAVRACGEPTWWVYPDRRVVSGVRELRRTDILCPGYDPEAKVLRSPLWEPGRSADALRSLVGADLTDAEACRARGLVPVTFARTSRTVGGYALPEFGAGAG